MKIALFNVGSDEKAFLSRLLAGTGECAWHEEALDTSYFPSLADTAILSVSVHSRVDKAALDALQGLKLIATRSTGFDHIDVDYAKVKGIVVVSVPGYGSRTVAEFAFALILALSRKVHLAIRYDLGTSDDELKNAWGFDLYGKTLGVVGTGRIGKNAVRIGKGFGMAITAFDLYPDEKFASEEGFSYAPIEEVLRRADIVTLHVPGGPSTHHLLNAGNIAFMKKSAYLVNTARGEVVDAAALSAALRAGNIAGAAIDVCEGEQDIISAIEESRESELLRAYREMRSLSNVLMTPHVASFTKEAKEEISRVTADNICLFIAGTPQNVL